MKKILMSIAATTLLSVNSYAGGGGLGGGATEVTQLLNNTELGAILAKESQQYATMIDQLTTQMNQLQQDIFAVQMMTQNLEDLNNFDWTDFAVSISGMQNVMQSANALSYSMSNFDQLFNDRYKGYTSYYNTYNNDALTPGQKSVTFSQQYRDISDTTRNTVKGTLDGLQLQENDFANEAATIATLRNNSRGAVGNKAVIQAANDIALFQVDQMRKLRLTVMSQVNLQSQFLAAQNERMTIDQSILDVSTDIKKPSRNDNDYNMGF